MATNTTKFKYPLPCLYNCKIEIDKCDAIDFIMATNQEERASPISAYWSYLTSYYPPKHIAYVFSRYPSCEYTDILGRILRQLGNPNSFVAHHLLMVSNTYRGKEIPFGLDSLLVYSAMLNPALLSQSRN